MVKALATIPSNNTLLLWIQIGHKVVTSTKEKVMYLSSSKGMG